MLVTVSGLHGSGESTQIEHLRKVLQERGITLRTVHMIGWNNIVLAGYLVAVHVN